MASDRDLCPHVRYSVKGACTRESLGMPAGEPGFLGLVSASILGRKSPQSDELSYLASLHAGSGDDGADFLNTCLPSP